MQTHSASALPCILLQAVEVKQGIQANRTEQQFDDHGLRQGGLLVSLLILPLYVPVMIFGVLSTSGFQTGIDNSATALLILAAIVLVALVVAPFASAAALRSYLK